MWRNAWGLGFVVLHPCGADRLVSPRACEPAIVEIAPTSLLAMTITSAGENNVNLKSSFRSERGRRNREIATIAPAGRRKCGNCENALQKMP
jgi:hypothetical protein